MLILIGFWRLFAIAIAVDEMRQKTTESGMTFPRFQGV